MKPYTLREEDTKRELRHFLLDDGEPLDISEATQIILRFKIGATSHERNMTKGDASNEVFYRWQEADIELMTDGQTYKYQIIPVWSDGRATVPTEGGFYHLKYKANL